MADTTARFALPLLAAGQAQKELFHNEALTIVDALLQPVIEALGTEDPPAAPVPGQCWIVGTQPTGAWAGHAAALAAWTDGGWRFAAPHAGMTAWSLADGMFVRFDGAVWQIGQIAGRALLIGGRQVVSMQQPAIAEPAGGGAPDAESRAAISAILAALRTHGLIAG